MSIDVAIIADDLTGALDTSVPFVLAGKRVAAATRRSGLPAALASGAAIVVANTGSRGLDAAAAATEVRAAAGLLREGEPRIVFKKIDSRLKGNVGVEARALAESFGFADLVVAPAVPDQQRVTVGGAVTGHGVATPIRVAPHFDGLSTRIVDAETTDDIDRATRETDWSRTLAVGARGFGVVLAGVAAAAPAHFAPESATLFAIGSRDPITESQVAALAGVDGTASRLPALMRPEGSLDAEKLERFADEVAAAVERLRPTTLVMSGGDTALAILDRLGVDLVFPLGEAGAGLPFFLIERKNHPSIRCVVKSGGFGDGAALAALLPPNCGDQGHG
jgi:uncharacterized protein YgbK (DUF1537 family)